MGTNAKALGIDRLSLDDRMQLVEEIWDSIVDESANLELPLSHRDEIDRRLEARNANPQAGSSWDVVRTRLLKSPEDAH
jgi:putative addiction module component (TIGR02574 family)